MNRSFTKARNAVPVDEDVAEQAHPGHGVPSQDPASAAQFLLEPEESEREANSVLMGGGMVAGAATGAAVGVVVAGPVGVVVGGTVGAVVGAVGAVAAGTMINPHDSSSAGATPTATALLQEKDSAGSGPPAAPLNKVIAKSAQDE